MGGYFGAVSGSDAVLDIFFGIDYHSHLGTKSAGIAMWNKDTGFKRQIHSIGNSPFRTKFERDLGDLHGTSGIGSINDTDPQPLIVRSRLGLYAIITTGIINNAEQLAGEYLKAHDGQLMAMGSGKLNSTELAAALINESSSIVEGLKELSAKIDGSLTTIILKDDGKIIAARDGLGRLPVFIGRKNGSCCVSLENFAFQKLGYNSEYELGPAEIVELSPDGYKVLSPAGNRMKICAFLWTYYGYPNSTYHGVNVETMRYRNGEIMAENDARLHTVPEVDYVAGVPDSGIAHAIGYARECSIPYVRPLVKYTPTWPRSFMPDNQDVRNQVARMKLIPVYELIKGKRLLFIDDSIVRGTQLKETVDFLYEYGAEKIHIRSACPPIMFACKYLNFSRGNSDMGLLARKIISKLEGEAGNRHIDEYADAGTERGKCLLKSICSELGFDSLSYQSLDGLLDAIGIDREQICTYCWTGKE